MPLALLLDETLLPFVRGADRLEPWTRLMELQSEILERARGIFLVRWFGQATPFDGRRPRVAIANLEQLRGRLLAVRTAESARSGDSSGPNLLEPLAGMTGQVAGLMLSPSGAIAASYAAFRLSRNFVVRLLAVLNIFTAGPLPTLLALGGRAAIGAMFGPSPTRQQTLGERSIQLGDVAALGASAARLAIAIRRFWDIVSGPRSRVANPVLREVLELGDAIAGLLVQLIGAFALLVTQIGPMLDPLARQLDASSALASDLINLAADVVEELRKRFRELIDGEHSPLTITERTIHMFGASFRRLLTAWSAGTNAFDAVIRDGGRSVTDAIGRWWDGPDPSGGPGGRLRVEALTSGHPAIRPLLAITEELRLAQHLWTLTKPPEPQPSGGSHWSSVLRIAALVAAPGPSLAVRFLTSRPRARPTHLVPSTTLPPLPHIPAFPSLPPLTRLVRPLARGLEALEDRLRPPLPEPPPTSGGVFAGRLRALRAATAEDLRPGLAEAELDGFRTLAERLVGSAAVAQIPRLDPLLRHLQDKITGPRTAPERLPVRDLGTARLLRADVGTLRLRLPEGDRAEADTWASQLRAELVRAPIVAPAGG